jgi:hypothetical protein
MSSKTRACYSSIKSGNWTCATNMLKEKNEERNGRVVDATAETTENNASTERKRPPDKPIQIFSVNAFPVWRKTFFRDWREEGIHRCIQKDQMEKLYIENRITKLVLR